jgi:hypothetical protein
MKAEVLEEVKKEVEKMLEAGFIRLCRYAEWILSVGHQRPQQSYTKR